MSDCKIGITLRVSATVFVFGFFSRREVQQKTSSQGPDICSSSVNVCWMNTWKQTSSQGGALTVLWELTVGWGCGQRNLAGGPRVSWSSGSECVQDTTAVVGTSGGARAGWEERRSRGPPGAACCASCLGRVWFIGGVGPGHTHHFLGDWGPLGGFTDPLFTPRGLAWMPKDSWLTWANPHTGACLMCPGDMRTHLRWPGNPRGPCC